MKTRKSAPKIQIKADVITPQGKHIEIGLSSTIESLHFTLGELSAAIRLLWREEADDEAGH